MIGKLAFTVCLFLFLGRVICSDFNKLKKGLADNFLISHIRIEREKVKLKARLMTLNHMMPAFDRLLEFLKDPKRFEHGRDTREYIDYYERVVEYIPRNADAYGMLGFFYYYSDDKKKAVEFYKKAVALNPQFFWFYYDLGVIYFKSGDYPNAAENFSKATAVKPEITLRTIASSQIYTSIIRSSAQFDYPMDTALKTAYENSYRLLALSYEHLKKKDSSTGSEKEGLDVRFF